MKTLVVSQDSAAAMFLEDVLRCSGYETETQTQVESAWTSFEREVPPLAMVDLTLPNQGGFELCRRMRQIPHGRTCVILALSAGSRTADLQAAVDAGADDYVWRPIDGQVIRLRLTVAEQRFRVRVERNQVEQKLRESEARYRALFDAAPDAVFLESLDGHILDCNRAACEMYGFAKEEWLGKGLKEILPRDLQDTIPALFDEKTTEGGAFRRTRNRRKDGREFPCDVSTRLVTIGGEKRAIVFVRDRSEGVERPAGG